MSGLTIRDDIKKQVSEILKRVDVLLRAAEIDQAIREVIQAKELDPHNFYILAYEERIEHLRSEHEKHLANERSRLAVVEAARRRDEELRKKATSPVPYFQKVQATLKTSLPPVPPQIASDGGRKVINSTPSKQTGLSIPSVPPLPSQQTKQIEKSPVVTPPTETEIREYQQVLTRLWCHGKPTPQQYAIVKELQSQYRISQDHHRKLESDIRCRACLAVLKRVLNTTEVSKDPSILSKTRKEYEITEEEYDRIQMELLRDVRFQKNKAKLALIDDDEQILSIVSGLLREQGYEVKPFLTSDDAFKYLKTESADMIISDINLETSTMGGFSFYQKIMELDKYRSVPFVFLSGLTDSVLIKTGKELGVDDYITKPFSEEMLLATVRGKLKRFGGLRANA
ncbi:MAG: response regulator [bacterium]